jgi:hypothetical protein
MIAARASIVAVLVLGGVVVALGACEKPVGSEGGPCTAGGACDPGLTCASNLCVNTGGGEGEGAAEGEGACLGDGGGAHNVDECASIPAAACAAIDSNETETACRNAGLTLRTALFDAAFECLSQISSADCHDTSKIDACFGALTTCSNPDAEELCDGANGGCQDAGDDNFDLAACVSDLTPTNAAFLDAWRNCFETEQAIPCSDIEEGCYGNATNTLIQNAGG